MPVGSYKFQFRYSMERDICDVYLKASVGAAGALTVLNSVQKGITSITRNSAGNYTILFKSASNLLLECTQTQLLAGATALSAPIMKVVSEQVANSTSSSMIIQFYSDAGAVADINNGAQLMLRISLRDAST